LACASNLRDFAFDLLGDGKTLSLVENINRNLPRGRPMKARIVFWTGYSKPATCHLPGDAPASRFGHRYPCFSQGEDNLVFVAAPPFCEGIEKAFMSIVAVDVEFPFHRRTTLVRVSKMGRGKVGIGANGWDLPPEIDEKTSFPVDRPRTISPLSRSLVRWLGDGADCGGFYQIHYKRIHREPRQGRASGGASLVELLIRPGRNFLLKSSSWGHQVSFICWKQKSERGIVLSPSGIIYIRE